MQHRICHKAAGNTPPAAAEIIQERIKMLSLEGLVDIEQASFHPGSKCIDKLNTLRIILEHCSGFRSSPSS